MDSLNFLIENDPAKLVKNPIVSEYLQKEKKSDALDKLVKKLANTKPLLRELVK